MLGDSRKNHLAKEDTCIQEVILKPVVKTFDFAIKIRTREQIFFQ